MNVVQTIEFTDKERLAIQKTLELADEIANITGRSLSEVLEYFANAAKFNDDYTCSISAKHQIEDIQTGEVSQ